MFLAIEGNEGAGKSEVARRVAAEYERRGRSVALSFEPGGTKIGLELRALLKDPKYLGRFPPLTELFGFLAARSAFVEKVVRPALRAGEIVITDRYSLSTMAYQISGRELPEKECMTAIKLAEGGLTPYYVVLLVPPEVGLQRKAKQGDAGDRFAREDLAFHRRVVAGYRYYANRLQRRGRATIIETDCLDKDLMFGEVMRHLDRRFTR